MTKNPGGFRGKMMERDNQRILSFVGLLTLTVLVQIVSIESFFSNSEIEFNLSGSNLTIESEIPEIVQKPNSLPKLINTSSEKNVHEVRKPATVSHHEILTDPFIGTPPILDTMRPPEEILNVAGIEVDDELKKTLPHLDDIVDMYGAEPIIIGTDRCEAFQKSIIKGEGFVGPAGMFNTVSNKIFENGALIIDLLKRLM